MDRRVELEGHRFASRSEGAVGVLMQEYIPGFVLEEGVTYSVSTGNLLNGILILGLV